MQVTQGKERPLPEVVAVDSCLNMDGKLTVRSFVWRGRQVYISATGRQWEEESPAGCRRCVLVMSAGGEIFELCLDGAEVLWYLRRASGREALV